jgi:hypothetical protein
MKLLQLRDNKMRSWLDCELVPVGCPLRFCDDAEDVLHGHYSRTVDADVLVVQQKEV